MDDWRSVTNPQSKLDSAWNAALMIHYTEGWPKAYAGFGELRMVEKVKYFGAELQLGLLCYIKGFVGREIEIRYSCSRHARVNSRFIAVRKRSGFREAACVEPL